MYKRQVQYAVDKVADFSYEAALTFEQLAVASWSLRLYYYGWLPKHAEQGYGGFTSTCNVMSNGLDGMLFAVVNFVAWMVAPFQIYMLVNCFAKVLRPPVFSHSLSPSPHISVSSREYD